MILYDLLDLDLKVRGCLRLLINNGYCALIQHINSFESVWMVIVYKTVTKQVGMQFQTPLMG